SDIFRHLIQLRTNYVLLSNAKKAPVSECLSAVIRNSVSPYFVPIAYYLFFNLCFTFSINTCIFLDNVASGTLLPKPSSRVYLQGLQTPQGFPDRKSTRLNSS